MLDVSDQPINVRKECPLIDLDPAIEFHLAKPCRKANSSRKYERHAPLLGKDGRRPARSIGPWVDREAHARKPRTRASTDPEAWIEFLPRTGRRVTGRQSTRGFRAPRRSNKQRRIPYSRARASLGDGIGAHRCSPGRPLPMRNLRYLRKALADPRMYDRRTLANALPHPRLGRIDEQSLGNKRFRLPNLDWMSITVSAHRITIAPLGRSRRLSKPLPVFPVSHRLSCDKCYGSARVV